LKFTVATSTRRGFSSAPHLTDLESAQIGLSPPEASLRRSTFTEKLTLTGERDDSWWTGKKPSECPGYSPDGKLYSLPQISFLNLTKGSVQDYFDNTWTLTEILMASLQGDAAFTVPPYHELRHPMIFYYGHTASLYVNKLRVAGLLKDPIDPYFEVLFETGVDEMSWDDLSKNRMQWPAVSEVHAYRKKVYSRVSELIQSLSEKDLATVNQKSPLWALFMGFEHERIHLETSSVLITELPPTMVKFPRGFPDYHKSVAENISGASAQSPAKGVDYPVNSFIDVEAQQVELGKPKDYPSYGW
jgi:DinB superfamily